MESRPAPGPPPAYVRAVGRVYRRPLRPVVTFVTGLSFGWAIVLGTRFLRNMGANGETPKMETFDLVVGIMFLVVAAIELFGLIGAITQKPKLAKLYIFLSGIAALITLAAELIRLVLHFMLKNDLIKQCIDAIQGQSFETFSGQTGVITDDDAQSFCSSDWNRGIWWDIGWLMITTILGIMFTAIAAAYYHQLQDPTFQRTQAPSNAFRMGRWQSPSDPAYLHQQSPDRDQPFIPPYSDPTHPSHVPPQGYNVAPPSSQYLYNEQSPPEYVTGSNAQGFYYNSMLEKNEKQQQQQQQQGQPREQYSQPTARTTGDGHNGFGTLEPVSLHDDEVGEDHRHSHTRV